MSDYVFIPYPMWVGDVLVNNEEEHRAAAGDAYRPPVPPAAEIVFEESGAVYVPLEYPKWAHGELVDSAEAELSLLERLDKEEEAVALMTRMEAAR